MLSDMFSKSRSREAKPGSSKITIDFDPKNNKLRIACPINRNGEPRDLPNRRWNKNSRVWTAPVIKLNVEWILENFKDEYFTKEAQKALSGFKDPNNFDVIEPFPAKHPFKMPPFHHQQRGLDFVYNKDLAALIMDMGTGKTKVVIDWFSALYLEKRIDAAVVICPVSIRMNWVRELAKQMPQKIKYKSVIVDGASAAEVRAILQEESCMKWAIVGIESLSAGRAPAIINNFIESHARVAMAVDESSRIKNHRAIRSVACVKLGRSAVRRVIMSGTPTTQSLMDLYMQYQFLSPDIIGIGDFWSFKNRYVEMGGYQNREVIGYRNVDELMQLLAPVTFQVWKSEALPDLPPKIYMPARVVAMTNQQKQIYSQLRKEAIVELTQGTVKIENVLERVLRMHQVANGILVVEKNGVRSETPVPGKDPKIEELMSTLEEVNGSVIIWAVYRQQIANIVNAIVKAYGEDSVVELHGGVSEKQRDTNVYELFQKEKARFLVGNQATGGMGLNLTAATTMIYMSNSFSLEQRLQSEDRAHRAGQTKSVTYMDFCTAGTVDGMVIAALTAKMDLADYVRKALREKHLDL